MTATKCSATALFSARLDDELFFRVTELLTAGFDRGHSDGELLDHAEAPQLLYDWFRHAHIRVPDLRVWSLSCRLESVFDPCSGISLPEHWPWDARDRLLALNAALRARSVWEPMFEAAIEESKLALRQWIDWLVLEAELELRG